MTKHRHFIVHKPFGYISQFMTNQKTRRSKKMLGELHDFPDGTMAIGRLDEHSEGLILLTTDGKMSERVRSKKVEKEYYAQVDGLITPESIRLLQDGTVISINKSIYTTHPCTVRLLDKEPDFPPRTKKIRDDRHGPTCWISIIITEGKYRQVRKMTAAAGFPTLRLFRVRIGNVYLNQMSAGEVIEVEDFDV